MSSMCLFMGSTVCDVGSLRQVVPEMADEAQLKSFNDLASSIERKNNLRDQPYNEAKTMEKPQKK